MYTWAETDGKDGFPEGCCVSQSGLLIFLGTPAREGDKQKYQG
jgi:hypothetical protein